ncbi:30S ribosomal protein S9 [Bacteroidota bacterium]
MEVVNALGRRKSAIARIFVNDGKGKITINKREISDYFPNEHYRKVIMQPLELVDAIGKVDIKVNLSGGGEKGQAEALRLAIARALIKIEPENKPILKSNGLLTRDPREVERKKPGRPKARKKFQFSKR